VLAGLSGRLRIRHPGGSEGNEDGGGAKAHGGL
jgi:hypothetical protein